LVELRVVGLFDGTLDYFCVNDFIGFDICFLAFWKESLMIHCSEMLIGDVVGLRELVMLWDWLG